MVMVKNLCLVDHGHAHFRHGCVLCGRGDGAIHDRRSRLFLYARDRGDDHGDVGCVVHDVRRRSALKQVVTVA